MKRIEKPLGLGARPWGIGSIVAILLGITGIAIIGGNAVGTASVVLVVFGVVCLLLSVGTYLGDEGGEKPV